MGGDPKNVSYLSLMLPLMARHRNNINVCVHPLVGASKLEHAHLNSTKTAFFIAGFTQLPSNQKYDLLVDLHAKKITLSQESSDFNLTKFETDLQGKILKSIGNDDNM